MWEPVVARPAFVMNLANAFGGHRVDAKKLPEDAPEVAPGDVREQTLTRRHFGGNRLPSSTSRKESKDVIHAARTSLER